MHNNSLSGQPAANVLCSRARSGFPVTHCRNGIRDGIAFTITIPMPTEMWLASESGSENQNR